MTQMQNNSSVQTISISRERFADQYVFCRLDDVNRTQTFGVCDSTLFEFVSQYKDVGGLDYFYSEVISKGMVLAGEHVKDIISEDGSILWANPDPQPSEIQETFEPSLFTSALPSKQPTQP